jgi:4-amino-4-deoxy-L-arabinose transferase-like glycosyltransferase
MGSDTHRVVSVETLRDHVPAIVFWSTAVFLSLWYLGARELWGPEERWAEVVREMRLTGDYFHPTINGDPYFDKPLLSYWLIAAAAAVTGRLDEWTVRLPSVLAGFLALGATIRLGRRFWSEQQARTAGWILLSTNGFLFWTRTGEADMENLAAIIVAVAWYWARRDKPTFISYLIFYAICFIGAQAKGMAAIAVPIVAVLPDLIRENRWRLHLSASHVLALAVGLLLYLAPLAYADLTRGSYGDSGLGMAFRENVTRYFQPFDHKEPFYVYFYYLPILLFPWIPLLVASLWASVTWFRELDWPTKWLAISTVLIFLFFTLSGSRRSYYILPILPFCALLASLYFDVERQEKPRSLTLRIQAGLLVGILAVEILSPPFWPVIVRGMGYVVPGRLIAATILLGVAGLAPLVLERLRPGLMARITGSSKHLAPIIATSLILVGGILLWQQGIADTYRTLRPFSLEIRRHMQDRPAEIVFFYPMQKRMLFYLESKKPARCIRTAEELEDFLGSAADVKVLISSAESHEQLVSLGRGKVAAEPTVIERVHPWETQKNKSVAWIIPGPAK